MVQCMNAQISVRTLPICISYVHAISVAWDHSTFFIFALYILDRIC